MEEVKNVKNEEAPGQPQVTGEGGQQVFSPDSIVNLSKAAFWLRFIAIILYATGGIIAIRVISAVANLIRWGWSLTVAASILMEAAVACLIVLLSSYLQATGREYRAFTRAPGDVAPLEVAFIGQKIYLKLTTILLLLLVASIITSVLLNVIPAS
jgi:hypothetical protein